MTKLFNSPFEMQLHLTLLMSEMNKDASLDRLVSLEFITVFGAEFGISNQNLHGNSMFRFSEIASKREQAYEAIRRMARGGLISISVDDGYKYSLSDVGRKYANSFEGSYAKEYRDNAKKAIKKYTRKSDQSLVQLIQNKAMEGR